MKVKQFAESRGITRQAVYNAVSKNGLKISQLTDSSGNLTPEGLSKVEELFPEDAVNRKIDKYLQNMENLQTSVDRLSAVVEQQEKTIAEQSAVIASLTETVDRLAKTADRESVNVSQAQQITAMLKISKEPLLKRLFAGKKETEQT